jgi:hypothetical protein
MLAQIGADAYSIATMVAAILAIVALGVVQLRGHGDHESEDDERSFFDEHGRWPDEPESAALRRPGGYGDVDDLPGRER